MKSIALILALAFSAPLAATAATPQTVQNQPNQPNQQNLLIQKLQSTYHTHFPGTGA